MTQHRDNTRLACFALAHKGTDVMASKTAVTTYRRATRHKNMGAARKARLRNHGTTPAFPVHTPAVDAAAPPAQVSPNNKAGK